MATITHVALFLLIASLLGHSSQDINVATGRPTFDFKGGKEAVFVCGPEEMKKDVRRKSAWKRYDLGVMGEVMFPKELVEEEIFEW